VDQPRQDALAAEIDLDGARPHLRLEDSGIRAQPRDTAILDRHRGVDLRLSIQGNDLPVVQNQVGVSRIESHRTENDRSRQAYIPHVLHHLTPTRSRRSHRSATPLAEDSTPAPSSSTSALEQSSASAPD